MENVFIATANGFPFAATTGPFRGFYLSLSSHLRKRTGMPAGGKWLSYEQATRQLNKTGQVNFTIENEGLPNVSITIYNLPNENYQPTPEHTFLPALASK